MSKFTVSQFQNLVTPGQTFCFDKFEALDLP